jgi:hypothetical protein
MARNPETCPTNPLNPPDLPGVVRILLGPTASATLDATGEKVFALVARDVWPNDRSRWVILLKPCPLALARQAEGVVLGTHRAARIRPPAQANVAPLPANLEASPA